MELNFASIDWKQEASGREKLYFALVLVLIVFMFARVVWIPKIDSIKAERQKIQGVKLQISTIKKFMEEKAKEALATQKNVEKPIGVGDELGRLLERSKDKTVAASSLVDALTSTSSLKGLSLTSMDFGTEVPKDGFYILPMGLMLSGTFKSLNKYLEQVEFFPDLLTIDNVDIKTGQGVKSEVLAKLSLSLYIMGKPTQPEVPKVKKGETEIEKGKEKK